MKIKIGKDLHNSFSIFITIIIAMQLKISRMILLMAICLILFFSSCSNNKKKPMHILDKYEKICRYEVISIMIFCVIQIITLGLSIRGIAMDVGVLSCVYIGIICGAISMKHYHKFESVLNAELMFLIMFSIYYIFEIIVNGLPEGRDSAIGNVSSNYCSAILYLNYPIILYYLFGRTEINKNDKITERICYLAIALSLIVIVSSGSRTAIGAVALMAIQLLFYKQKKMKNKIKVLVVLIASIFGLVIAYRVNTSVQELIDRALNAFGGKQTLDNNVRQLIWAAGIDQFRKGNVAFGLGTSTVTRFERSAHNLFYEVLMCSGYIGIALFFILFSILLISLFLKQKYQQRFFTVMLMIVCLITAYVQPFFSSSYTCGIMMWVSLFALTADSGRGTL